MQTKKLVKGLTIFATLISLKSFATFGQSNLNIVVPEIGKEFYGSFINDPKNDEFFKSIKNKYKGKYLIFDLFSSGCAGCFISFPKIKELQEQFTSKVQFILIGYEDKHIRKQFDVYQKKLNLNIPVIYDSIFANRVVPAGFPHLIWVDTLGIIRAITSSGPLSIDNLNKFVRNEQFEFFDRSHAGYKAMSSSSNGYIYDWYLALDRDSNRVARVDLDTNNLFKSELGIWKVGMTMNAPEIVRTGPNANRAIIGMGSLANLFLFSIFGGINWNTSFSADFDKIDSSSLSYKVYPKLEASYEDSLQLYGSLARPGSLYWYRQIENIEHISDEDLRRNMLEDLCKIFNYETKLVKKKVKCYNLVADQRAFHLLKTKGGTPNVVADKSSIHIKNKPMPAFSNLLFRGYLAVANEHNVYFDETRITDNIDISIEDVLFDRESMRKSLQKYGLDIVEGEKEMLVIVITKHREKINKSIVTLN